MDRLKILILSDYAFVKGGAERVAITSSIALAEKGHEVVFFSAVGPVSKELSHSAIKKIICLCQEDILDSKNKVAASIRGIYNSGANRKLKSLLKEWLPDIAHIHGVSKALSWSPVNVLFSCSIPVVYTLHDYGLLCPNLGIYNYKKEENCLYYQRGYGIKCLFTDCDKRNYYQKLWRWLRYFITRYFFRLNKKISGYVAVSNFISGIFIDNRYMKKEKIRVIHNPVDVPAVITSDITKKQSADTLKKFLYVGRLSREKGIDLLVDIMEDLDAKLIIIGNGELLEYCKHKSEEVGLNKLEVLGYQNRERIFQVMSESISLVLPSRCMEPAPLVIGEAACCGLPSIVADTGGLKELVEDGVTGFYFKAGDPESLKKIMLKLVENQEEAANAGGKAMAVMHVSDFNIVKHIDKLVRFYNDILASKYDKKQHGR